MLSAPDAGWTEFRLGSEETAYSLSYLTDVAVEWLDQAIHGLETMDVFSVHGVCEPGRMVCTVSYWNCYIIYEGEDKNGICETVHTVHVSMIDFCRKLWHDISENLEAWVHWDDGSLEDAPDEDEEDESDTFKEALARRREAIRGKLDRLKGLIDQEAGDYDQSYFL